MENIKEFNRQALAKNILAQKLPNHTGTVFYVNLYKQSETGLMFNERMLVIDDKSFIIFYTKYFKPLPLLYQLQKKGTNPIKEKIHIMYTMIQKQENIITIKFTNEDNDKRNWIFKFSSNDLAQKWMFLYHELHQKCINKSIKTKESKSTNISQYNSILSNLKYNIYPPQISEKQKQWSEENGLEKNKKVKVKKIQENYSQ